MTDGGLFGKNILEVLTTGMYREDKTIFREYIQNSADSIRNAEKLGYFSDEFPPSIDIQLDMENKSISIEDNGMGVKVEDVKKRLMRIADSVKNEDEDIGYRGIGRLCGLAYCDTLRITTRYAGENECSIMTWDAKKLRTNLDDISIKKSPEEILNEIISCEVIPDNSGKDHYFKIELINIISGHENLLNKDFVEQYISDVGPVDFAPQFIFGKKIIDFAKENNFPLPIYTVTLEGKRVYKNYTLTIYETKGQSACIGVDKITDVEFHIFSSQNGETIGWLWFGICAFDKQLSKANKMRGIRLKRHNIELGDEHTLDRFFPESRGNLYYVGEYHITHRLLRPNNQRDYIRDISTDDSNNVSIRNEFETQLSQYCRNALHKYYRDANTLKSSYKTKQELNDVNEKISKKEEEGFVNDKEKDDLYKKRDALSQKNANADKAISRLENSGDETFSKIANVVKQNHEPVYQVKTPSDTRPKGGYSQVTTISQPASVKKTSVLVDSLHNLTAHERSIVSAIYSEIKEIMPEDKAIILINRLQDRLKKI